MTKQVVVRAWVVRALFWGVVGFSAFAYLLLHIQVPLFADDYCRIAPEFSLGNSLNLAWRQYWTWSGRFPVMLLNWLVFSGGELGVVALSVASGGMLVLLCIMVVRIRDVDAPYGAKTLLVACLLFLLWMVPDTFGEVALWKSGTLQYFWATVLALYCLAPVVKLTVHGSTSGSGPVGTTIFAAVCFVAGMWLEHVSVSVSGVWLGLLIVNRWFRRRDVPRWLWVCWVLWTLGAIMLVLAPGNYERAEVLGEHNIFSEKLLMIAERFLDKIDPKLWLTCLVFVGVGLVRPHPRGREQIEFSVIFLALSAASAVSLAAAPNVMYFGRIAYPSEFFLVLAVVFAFPIHVFRLQKNEATAVIPVGVIVALCGVMLVLLVIDYPRVLAAYHHLNVQHEQRVKRLVNAAENKEQSVTVKPLYFSATRHTGTGEINEGRWFARDITGDPAHWLNRCYAKAYGLKNVILEP